MNDYLDMTRGVTSALAQLPQVTVGVAEPQSVTANKYLDLVVRGEVKNRPVLFLVECKNSVTPRVLHEAMQQLRQYSAASTIPTVPIIAAPAIPQHSRELLRQHGVGYWDTGGSLYVDLPWALFWIDKPVPALPRRKLRDPYRGSAAQVLHALLQRTDRSWHVSELAEHAQVSVSTAHQVCTFLEDQLWMEKAGKGPRAIRTLRQPGALLDAWAAAYSLARYSQRLFHRWAPNPLLMHEAITAALDHGGVEYALTLSSGAELVAPHGTNTEHIWVLIRAEHAGQLDDALAPANVRRVEDGESLTVLISHERGPLLFRREVCDFWVASDAQLYLDLWAWPRRGREQARHLRAERLGY